MKRFLLVLVLLFANVALFSDTPAKKYIEKYKDIAISEMQRSGVPASITLAQGILESGSGLSTLAVEGKNHFGIKCHKTWKGKKIYLADDKPNDCFRVYKTVEESFRDHSDFLRYHDRYRDLFELDITDYKGWAKGLKKAGYATSPSYAEKLIKLIESYELYQYDRGVSPSAIPQAPRKVEESTQVQVAGPAMVGAPRESYSFNPERKVFKKNGILCVYAEPEDSFASIAMEFDLFEREVLKFNDLKASRPLKIGEVVYLKAKKKYASKGIPMHVVSNNDESLWEISQRFGVKLKSILKLNGLSADYIPVDGDVIHLRKLR